MQSVSLLLCICSEDSLGGDFSQSYAFGLDRAVNYIGMKARQLPVIVFWSVLRSTSAKYCFPNNDTHCDIPVIPMNCEEHDSCESRARSNA